MSRRPVDNTPTDGKPFHTFGLTAKRRVNPNKSGVCRMTGADESLTFRSACDIQRQGLTLALKVAMVCASLSASSASMLMTPPTKEGHTDKKQNSNKKNDGEWVTLNKSSNKSINAD